MSSFFNFVDNISEEGYERRKIFIAEKYEEKGINGIKLRKSHITENVVWDFFVKFYMNMY